MPPSHYRASRTAPRYRPIFTMQPMTAYSRCRVHLGTRFSKRSLSGRTRSSSKGRPTCSTYALSVAKWNAKAEPAYRKNGW